MDDDIKLVPNGEVGEICVAGVNVADGYRDGRKECFIQNPFSDYSLLYKTGDF